MIERERVRALLAEGKRPSEVARILGCVPATIFKIRRKLEEAGADFSLAMAAPPVATAVNMPLQPPVADPSRNFGTPVAPAAPKVDPELARAQLDIAKLNLEAQRLEAEERLARIRRERDATQPAPASSNGADLTALRMELAEMRRDLRDRGRDTQPATSQMESFVPLIQTFLSSLMNLLGQLVTKTSEPAKEIDLAALQALAGGGGNPVDSLGSIVPLVKQVLDLANEIGGGAGGGGGSDLAQIVGALAPVLTQAQAGGRAPGMLPQSGQAGGPQQQQQDPMLVRIATFLLAIEREARARTDPWTVAEAIERDLNLCPEEFRNLFLNNGANEILAGLGRFVPQQIHARITGLMQQNQGARRWLVEFVEALQHDEPTGVELAEEEPDTVTPRFEKPEYLDGAAPHQEPAPDVPDVFGVGPDGPEPPASVPPPSAI